MYNSLSCFGSTKSGAPLIKSVAFCVFGNAITSLIDSAPAKIDAILSTPKAIPPCGGVPYFNASTK